MNKIALSSRFIKEANKYAKKSVSSKNPVKRQEYREKYRHMAEESYNALYWQMRVDFYKNRQGFADIDTYPPLYADFRFADWEEDNEHLISDRSNFEVRHCTSYCAHKIHEATGIIPRKVSPRAFHAKHWVHFLEEAGYKRTASKPEKDHYFVGINANIGKNGLVVWYEPDGRPVKDENKADYVYNEENGKFERIIPIILQHKIKIGRLVPVSTYVNQEYKYFWIHPGLFTWVKII